MDILYAPWRDKYITHNKKQGNISDEACVFCEKNAEQDPDKQEFVLKKTKHAFIILNFRIWQKKLKQQ